MGLRAHAKRAVRQVTAQSRALTVQICGERVLRNHHAFKHSTPTSQTHRPTRPGPHHLKLRAGLGASQTVR